MYGVVGGGIIDDLSSGTLPIELFTGRYKAELWAREALPPEEHLLQLAS